jgi:hypothetical protein
MEDAEPISNWPSNVPQWQAQVEIQKKTLEVAVENGNAGVTRSHTLFRGRGLRSRAQTLAASPQQTSVVPLMKLIPTLTPLQLRFFEKLDSELEKIECFYMDREKEAKAR